MCRSRGVRSGRLRSQLLRSRCEHLLQQQLRSEVLCSEMPPFLHAQAEPRPPLLPFEQQLLQQQLRSEVLCSGRAGVLCSGRSGLCRSVRPELLRSPLMTA